MTHPLPQAAASSVPIPKKSKLPAISVAALVLLIGGTVLITGADVLRPAHEVRVEPVVFERSATVQPASTDAEPSEPRSTVTVQAPGWLEADPFFVACTALADGVVEEILVLEGERVEKGQPVATLVRDDARLTLDRAQADLASARAERLAAQADAAAAHTDWDHPVHRERAVSTARAAVEETNAELAQLPSLIEAERALLERMQEDLARLINAEKYNAANNFEVIIREKDVARQAAVLESVERRRAILQAKLDRHSAELVAAERDFELRIDERRELDAARAGLARAEARVAAQHAVVGEAQLRLDRMTISAPISGFVQHRLKVPGDKVMFAMDAPHSAHLLHLYDPEKLQVRVDVPLVDAANVYVGQRCDVIVDVLPDSTFEGEVTRITHEADLQKNTLQVKVRVISPPKILKPEMLTRVKFLPDSPRTSRGASETPATPFAPVFVTTRTLRERAGSSARVWVVRERHNGVGVAMPVSVEVVGAEDDVSRVTGDLHPGDLLISDDIALTQGQRVRIVQLPQTGGTP